MTNNMKKWISIVLLIAGAILLSAAWYVLPAGEAMGRAVLSTAVIWPIIVAVTSVLEIVNYGTLRNAYIVLVLGAGLIVSFLVRFPGGALVSGLIMLMIVYGMQQIVHTKKSRK